MLWICIRLILWSLSSQSPAQTIAIWGPTSVVGSSCVNGSAIGRTTNIKTWFWQLSKIFGIMLSHITRCKAWILWPQAFAHHTWGSYPRSYRHWCIYFNFLLADQVFKIYKTMHRWKKFSLLSRRAIQFKDWCFLVIFIDW